jgi:hypothetical protein
MKKMSQTTNNIVDRVTEQVRFLLSNPPEGYQNPRVSGDYYKRDIFCSKMRNTYGTKEIAELVTDEDSKYYADYRLPWAYMSAQRYGLDYWGLYEMCEYEDPYFMVPQDYRLGLNDGVYRVDMSIKDATMRNSEMYKPSVEHIVPTSLGGPVSDLKNIMILPLKINKILSNLTPIEVKIFLEGITNKSYSSRIAEAESIFIRG